MVEHQLPKLRVAGSIPVVRFSGLSLNPPRKAGFGVSEAAFVLPTETVRNRLRLALTGAQLARNCAAPANRGCRVSSAPQMVAGAWTFGWDALVALGTIGLAFVTALLAWLTRGVYEEANNRLIVPLRNSGRGPALFVRTLLDPYRTSPSNWSLGPVAPGDMFRLIFDGVDRLSTAQVLVDYRDLSGRFYSSAFVIDSDGTPSASPSLAPQPLTRPRLPVSGCLAGGRAVGLR